MTLRAFSDLLESFTKMDCTLLHTQAYMYNSVCFIYYLFSMDHQKERLSLSATLPETRNVTLSHVWDYVLRDARVFDD